jgi:hypothetical protein
VYLGDLIVPGARQAVMISFALPHYHTDLTYRPLILEGFAALLPRSLQFQGVASYTEQDAYTPLHIPHKQDVCPSEVHVPHGWHCTQVVDLRSSHQNKVILGGSNYLFFWAGISFLQFFKNHSSFFFLFFFFAKLSLSFKSSLA